MRTVIENIVRQVSDGVLMYTGDHIVDVKFDLPTDTFSVTLAMCVYDKAVRHRVDYVCTLEYDWMDDVLEFTRITQPNGPIKEMDAKIIMDVLYRYFQTYIVIKAFDEDVNTLIQHECVPRCRGCGRKMTYDHDKGIGIFSCDVCNPPGIRYNRAKKGGKC